MHMADRKGRTMLTVALALALVAGVTLLVAGLVGAQDNNPLASMLRDSGLKYSAVGDSGTSWKVPFDTDNGKTMNVFVTYNNDKRKFCMMFCTAVDLEKKHDYNRGVLLECMKYNNDYPACKFVLDYDNGDIDCQNEVLMKTLTPETLSAYVNLIASMVVDKQAKLNQLAED